MVEARTAASHNVVAGSMLADEEPPTHVDRDKFQYIENLENHLAYLEKQIERLIKLAPTLTDDEQDDCWERARELQREVRSTRRELKQLESQRNEGT